MAQAPQGSPHGGLAKADQVRLFVKPHTRRTAKGVTMVRGHSRISYRLDEGGRLYYASGANHPGEIMGYWYAGQPMGVSALELGPRAIDLLVKLPVVPLFVDSGAFSELDRTTGAFTPMSDATWERVLSVYDRLAEREAPTALVAPDAVGNQELTLARMREYAPRVQALADKGVEVLVPLQAGELDLGRFWVECQAALGLSDEDLVPAIPSNKKAAPPRQVQAFIQEHQPPRVHLLGLGPKTRTKAGRALLEAIPAISPDTQISLDSNFLQAKLGRTNGPGGGPRLGTQMADAATWLTADLAPEDPKQATANRKMMQTALTRALSKGARLVFRLTKGAQLALDFSRVRAHARRTAKGLAQVKQHERQVSRSHNAHVGQRTMGVSEAVVRELVDKALAWDRIEHRLNGTVKLPHYASVDLGEHTVANINGEPRLFNLYLSTARRKKTQSGRPIGFRAIWRTHGMANDDGTMNVWGYDLILQTPPGVHKAEAVAQSLRSTIAHELTHAMERPPRVSTNAQMNAVNNQLFGEDATIRHYVRARLDAGDADGARQVLEAAKAAGPELQDQRVAAHRKSRELYFNSPAEVRAYKHQLYRELNDTKSAALARELRDQGVNPSEIVAQLLASTGEWSMVAPYLTPANRRAWLETAGTLVARHLADESTPMEKAVRFIFRLTKAAQLSLFGGQSTVKAHARKTPKGITQVKEHQRKGTVGGGQRSQRLHAKMMRSIDEGSEAAKPKIEAAAREARRAKAAAARKQKQDAEDAALLGHEYAKDIGLDLATTAHNGTSHVPETRGRQVIREYVEHLQGVEEHIGAMAQTDAERAAFEEAFATYRAGYASRTRAWLTSRAGMVSSMVAGPANFPVARMRKRSNAADNKVRDLLEYAKKGRRTLVQAIEAQRVSDAGGPAAAERLKLEAATRQLATMKAANRVVRSKKNPTAEKKLAALVELGIDADTAASLLKPDFAGRYGFPSYALTNHRAGMKRMEARIRTLEAKESTAHQEHTFKGGRIEYAVDADRIRLHFDDKPPEEMRRALKGRGFRWAPSIGVWQRKLTDNAIAATAMLLDVDLPYMEKGLLAELLKAEQLGFFGGQTTVKAHPRKTRQGLTQVKMHVRAPRHAYQGDKLKAGERVLTRTGRVTRPVPKSSSGSSNRQWMNALKRMDSWLLSEGIAEAEANGDDHLVLAWSGEHPKQRLPPATRWSLNDYLFPKTAHGHTASGKQRRVPGQMSLAPRGKDHVTLPRIRGENVQHETFQRGERVDVWLSRDRHTSGVIRGLRMAEQGTGAEINVDGIWHFAGRIYKHGHLEHSLHKGDQMSLFGTVKAHARKTPKGITQVKQHQRKSARFYGELPDVSLKRGDWVEARGGTRWAKTGRISHLTYASNTYEPRALVYFPSDDGEGSYEQFHNLDDLEATDEPRHEPAPNPDQAKAEEQRRRIDHNTPGRINTRIQRRPLGPAAWSSRYAIKGGEVVVKHYPPDRSNPFASDHGTFYAFDGDKAVGWLNANDGKNGKIAFDIEVDVDHRRIGVASALLESVVDRTGMSPIPSSHDQDKPATADAEALWAAVQAKQDADRAAEDDYYEQAASWHEPAPNPDPAGGAELDRSLGHVYGSSGLHGLHKGDQRQLTPGPKGPQRPKVDPSHPAGPGRYVSYHCPKTGTARRGQVYKVGAKGCTVIDDETGAVVKVHHGHYNAEASTPDDTDG